MKVCFPAVLDYIFALIEFSSTGLTCWRAIAHLLRILESTKSITTDKIKEREHGQNIPLALSQSQKLINYQTKTIKMCTLMIAKIAIIYDRILINQHKNRCSGKNSNINLSLTRSKNSILEFSKSSGGRTMMQNPELFSKIRLKSSSILSIFVGCVDFIDFFFNFNKFGQVWSILVNCDNFGQILILFLTIWSILNTFD